LSGLCSIAKTTKIVLPIHPRTRKLIAAYRLDHFLRNVIVVDPVSFIDMVALEQSASVIVTDSGGVQKEAFFYGVPCITMRDETEWVETVNLGANQLVGADANRISEAFYQAEKNGCLDIADQPYGNGCASDKILKQILSCH
jgi:UDP-GlcNAc3NAcA epimerase